MKRRLSQNTGAWSGLGLWERVQSFGLLFLLWSPSAGAGDVFSSLWLPTHAVFLSKDPGVLREIKSFLRKGELITHGFAFAPITAGERLRMLSVQILSVTCIFPVHFPTFPSASLASYYKIRRHLALVWFRPSCCVAPPALVNVRCWRGPETAGGRSGLCSPRSTSPLHGLEPGLPVSVF